jgi:hypothetical protein
LSSAALTPTCVSDRLVERRRELQAERTASPATGMMTSYFRSGRPASSIVNVTCSSNATM